MHPTSERAPAPAYPTWPKLGRLWQGFQQMVWPSRCLSCDQLVPFTAAFCGPCALTLEPVGENACRRCALPLDVPEAAPRPVRTCAGCARVRFPFAAARAAYLYGGAMARALVRMKHSDRRDLLSPLARLLVPTLRAALGDGVDVIVPVPLHPRRLRKRGYNQALELARLALKQLRAWTDGVVHFHARHPAPVPVSPQVLRRVLDTEGLGHLGPAERRRRLAGAFRPGGEPSGLQDRRILLVDDVFTTGATFTACSETLLEAGAASVAVLALARAV